MTEKWVVIGIDGGIDTGLALRVHGKSAVHRTTVRWPQDFSRTEQAHVCVKSLIYVMDWIESHTPSDDYKFLFSAELFRQYEGSVSATPATTSAQWIHAQMVAMFTYEYGQRAHWCRFTAGTAKGSVTNERLRNLGLWERGRTVRHEMDAVRCLVLGEKKLGLRRNNRAN